MPIRENEEPIVVEYDELPIALSEPSQNELDKWRYKVSVNKVIQLHSRSKEDTKAIIRELHIAKQAIKAQGARNDKYFGTNDHKLGWKYYCEAVGINRRTADRWLNAYNKKKNPPKPPPKVTVVNDDDLPGKIIFEPNLISNDAPIDDFANTLIHGDCFESIKLLPDKSVDLVVTSPPYAKMKNYGDEIPLPSADEYADWFLPLAEQIERVLKDNGSFIVNIQDEISDGYRTTYVFETILKIVNCTNLKFFEMYPWIKQGNSKPSIHPKRLTPIFE